jgi:predicted secreted protein
MPNRSRRIAVVAHCVLNANSKVCGLVTYPGAVEPMVSELIASGAGIVQLPCPETTFLGMRRWGMTYEQYDTPAYRRHCESILQAPVDELAAFSAAGYDIERVIGIDGSPSCGVHATCRGYEGGEVTYVPTCSKAPGRGVFIETLQAMLEARNLTIPFDAIDEDSPEG